MDAVTAFFLAHLSTILFGVFALLLLISIFCIVLFVRYRALRMTMDTFLQGKDGASLEELIASHSTQITELDEEIQELCDHTNTLREILRNSLYKKHVVRYNPFQDLGGDQSFVAVFLDGRNDGLLISSLHTRDGTRVYAKPIVKGESPKYKLSDEESAAVRDAIASTTL